MHKGQLKSQDKSQFTNQASGTPRRSSGLVNGRGVKRRADPNRQKIAVANRNVASQALAEVAQKPPMRCAFGATRAGALLGRLRLHLQTERFLAAHRGDAFWERACVGSAMVLTDIVAAMQEDEAHALLPPQDTPDGRALGPSVRALLAKSPLPAKVAR